MPWHQRSSSVRASRWRSWRRPVRRLQHVGTQERLAALGKIWQGRRWLQGPGLRVEERARMPRGTQPTKRNMQAFQCRFEGVLGDSRARYCCVFLNLVPKCTMEVIHITNLTTQIRSADGTFERSSSSPASILYCRGLGRVHGFQSQLSGAI